MSLPRASVVALPPALRCTKYSDLLTSTGRVLVSMAQPAFLTSPYNFRIPLPDAELVYSSYSGAVISLAGEHALPIAQALSGGVRPICLQHFPESLVEQLRDGGFVTPDPAEQLKTIQSRFRAARSDYPVVLTLTTTMDCNLGCYYCYEERSSDRLDKVDLQAILTYARDRLSGRKDGRLHVDWYGGEPL